MTEPLIILKKGLSETSDQKSEKESVISSTATVVNSVAKVTVCDILECPVSCVQATASYFVIFQQVVLFLFLCQSDVSFRDSNLTIERTARLEMSDALDLSESMV